MGELAWREPSPSDWTRWIERLLAGEEPSQAARAEGQTCSSFRRQDPERHAQALALSREIRAGEDREYVRDRLRRNVEQSLQAVPVYDREGNETGEYTYRGDYANKALELLGRHAAMFEDATRVEVAHSGTVRVEHERRLTLDDLAEFARGLSGSRGGAGGELPAARALLPAPVED